VLRMEIPSQRQPHIDVNQVRGRRVSPCWGTAVLAGPSL
jgi:hypothetical protein